MVHPDYQYSPRLVPAIASMIAYGEYDMVLGSRILAQDTVARGMPRYKYVANRFLTFVEMSLLSQKLSEYHTGLRAFSSGSWRACRSNAIPTILSSTTSHRPGGRRGRPDRRGILPHPLSGRRFVDQPAAQHPLRLRRAADERGLPDACARREPLPLFDFDPAAVPAGRRGSTARPQA